MAKAPAENDKDLSEVQKLEKKWAEEDAEFKCSFDVEHVFYLISSARGLHDAANLGSLVGAIQKELKALNAEQQEKDDELREKREKEMAEAKAKDEKKAKEKAEKEAKENAPSPPSPQPRDTQAHARA